MAPIFRSNLDTEHAAPGVDGDTGRQRPGRIRSGYLERGCPVHFGRAPPMAVCPVSLSDKKHWISVDVSDLDRDWLSAALPNHGLALIGVAPVW